MFKEASNFYQSLKCETKKGIDSVSKIISIDYGNDLPTEDSFECYVLRGTDINKIKSGKSGKPVIRYVKRNKIKDGIIQPYDILIEISGGSPSQSTGRSCIINDLFLNSRLKNYGTSGFSRTIRCKTIDDALSLYFSISYAHIKGMFFQYENGSNGIKNLNLTIMLKELSIKVLSSEDTKVLKSLVDQAYFYYEKTLKIKRIKELLLSKYF